MHTIFQMYIILRATEYKKIKGHGCPSSKLFIIVEISLQNFGIRIGE